MAQLADVLLTAALRHGVDATWSVEEAAADLCRRAAGDRAAIRRALAHVRYTLESRPSEVGTYALEALERAAASTEQQARRDAELLLRKVVDAAPAMMAYWDADRRNITGNAAYVNWFGVTPRDMRGLHMCEVLGEEVYEGNLPHIDAVLSGTLERYSRRLVDASGESHLVQATYSPDFAGGRVVGFSVLVTDVTPFLEGGPAVTPTDAGAPRVRIVVVDADLVTRAGLARILASAPDLEVVREAAGVEEALVAVEEDRPDVVVIDARAAGMAGLVRARKASLFESSRFPEVLALTASTLDQYFLDPVLGAALRRPERPEDLVDGVRAAARRAAGGGGSRATTADARWRLTPREREVLDLAMRGYSNADIGRHLFLSVDTVKTHLRNLYAKLGLRNRRDLIAAAYDERLEGARA